ncbi:DUF885 family protein [Pleionea sp. CnH1-48]|uniref:DUF885 domain-containing protein n=1 Tax=Pleionea sp. CnH1-48 TaxID=2954494 RepID=UPI002097F568|nr:DUF885 domain-containing protein [Pleionea sp. CnH1-48]MCO7226910.1 DUF885 domain-containing protein [Pleionea sp. CnH1-48]
MTNKNYVWLWLVFVFPLAVFADESNKLQQIFKDDWDYQIKQSPAGQFNQGDKKTKGGFRDESVAAYQQRLRHAEKVLEDLQQLDVAQLTDLDKINLDIFRFQIRSRMDNIEHQAYLFPMVGDTGFYFGLIRLPETTDIQSEDELRFYLETVQAIPVFLRQWKANMKLGMQQGLVMPKVVLKDFEKPLLTLLSGKKKASPFLGPLDKANPQLPPEKIRNAKKQLKTYIKRNVEPALKDLIAFIKKKYIPAGRENIAATSLPNGASYYQSQINYYTTLPLSADDIHKIGLEEVKRIRAEMDKVIASTGFKGSFAEFLEFLRTDPRFYAKSAEELLKEAAYISKKMDGQLPKFFGHLPRQPYTVEPVPAAIAPRYTTGRYSGAPLNSTRAGAYWVNTYALDKRPLYVLEALTLHEAVPGHHLQSALTKELDNLPDFRRYSYLSAYGEGWALYSEKLGKEAGFYQDPYSDFGRLTYEMWRAIRLVVDTGMHAKGWSRQQAIEFMESNTALSKHNVRTEIDRYIAWPAQALSYKLGELKIWELRRLAEKELARRFDIRDFHDQLLSYGPMPLNLLEQEMKFWINTEKNKAPE